MTSKVLGVAVTGTVVAIGAAYTKAYNNSKALGRMSAEAQVAGVNAVATQAAMPLANGTTLLAAVKYGTPAIKIAAMTVGKAVLPASMAVFAAKYAATAYGETQSVKAAGKAAAYGAFNAIVPIDLIRDASASFKKRRVAEQVAKEGDNLVAAPPSKLKGWANPDVQKKAQQARRAKRGQR